MPILLKVGASCAALCVALTLSGARARAEPGCVAAASAPDSVRVLTEPAVGSRRVASVARRDVATLVVMDGAGTPRGDWLKVGTKGVAGWVSSAYVVCRLPGDVARRIIASDAARVVAALESADVAALARAAHPTKGVRFSPYAAVDRESDVVLTAAQLRDALRSSRERVWGTEDGSGAPIRLTFRAYLRRFAYDRDFARAPTITYNAPDARTQAVWDAYPSAIVAEFAMPETDARPAESLLLLFERHRGAWYLSGVVHAGWTI